MKLNFSTVLGSALVTTGFVSMIAVAPASAGLTLTGLSCTETDEVSLGGVPYTACEGAFAGNDTNSSFLDDLNSGVLFNDHYNPTQTWSFAAKNEGDSWLSAPETTDGEWSFTLPEVLNKATFILNLKSSTAFSSYLFKDFDFGGVTSWSGVFDTLGVSLNPRNGNPQDLSHASLYFASGGGTVDPEPVPEPATLLGLAVVGGGLSLSRRRKSTSC
ncbi:PEP-CTERM sorting domain-containing protein [Laspinema palackyanum]|uniref:PEP-CTERM sorting domain-containing protein n=1 Tax=Laspinema palackyanum TaxID=3231601 RepID=UPI00345D6CDE|nr:PEP-CTERM sorting domain-containing protein [Laspinema sp. D2c]